MSDLVKKLTQAKQLFDAGVLSEAEYQELRERYMGDLERSEEVDSKVLEDSAIKPTTPAPKAEPKPFIIDLFKGLNSASEASASEAVKEKLEDDGQEEAEAEARQKEEEDRLAAETLQAEEERKAEEECLVEEKRVAEEAKRVEEEKAQKKREEEAKKAEELRLLEEKQKAEEAHKEKEARLADEQRKQEEAKALEEEKKAENESLSEKKGKQEQKSVEPQKNTAEEPPDFHFSDAENADQMANRKSDTTPFMIIGILCLLLVGGGLYHVAQNARTDTHAEYSPKPAPKKAERIAKKKPKKSRSRTKKKTKRKPKYESNSDYLDGKRAFVARDNSRAIRLFRSCLSDQPENTYCKWELGWVYFVVNDIESCFRMWNEIQDQDPYFRNGNGDRVPDAFSYVEKTVRKHWEGRWRTSNNITKRDIDLSVTYSNHQLRVSGRYLSRDCSEWDDTRCYNEISVNCSGDWSSIQKGFTHDTGEILSLELKGGDCPTLKRIHPKGGSKSCFIDGIKISCP